MSQRVDRTGFVVSSSVSCQLSTFYALHMSIYFQMLTVVSWYCHQEWIHLGRTHRKRQWSTCQWWARRHFPVQCKHQRGGLQSETVGGSAGVQQDLLTWGRASSYLSGALLTAYPEELLGGARVQRPVGDLRLLGQVLGALDGRHHPLHREEGRQVGRVGGDDDEGEEPPHPAHDAPWQRPGGSETGQTWQKPTTTWWGQLALSCWSSL